MIVIDLIYNLALLIALSVVSGFIDVRWRRNSWPGILLQGLLFGSSAVIGMLRPFVFAPGLIFDGRSVMISLGALFFGPWAALVTCLMTITVRIIQGGAGVYMGILVILSSALIGVIYHFLYRSRLDEISSSKFMEFGLLVHFSMITMVVALPKDMIYSVFDRIAWPVMLTYPIATVLIGKILTDQAGHRIYVDKLQESEDRYRELIDQSNSVILRMTSGGTIVFFNQYAQQFFGFSEPEILGKNVVGTIVPPLDSAGKDLASVFREICSNPEKYPTYENENMRKDGTRCWMAWTNKGILDEKSRLINILCIGTDITARKRAEDALRESEQKFKSFIESAPDGVFLANEKGEYIEVNQAACKMTGYAKEELLNTSMLNLVPEEDIDEGAAYFKQVVSEGFASGELGLLTKSGEKRYWSVAAIKLSETRFLGFAKDITNHKMAEEALKQQNVFNNLIIDSVPGLSICWII